MRTLKTMSPKSLALSRRLSATKTQWLIKLEILKQKRLS